MGDIEINGNKLNLDDLMHNFDAEISRLLSNIGAELWAIQKNALDYLQGKSIHTGDISTINYHNIKLIRFDDLTEKVEALHKQIDAIYFEKGFREMPFLMSYSEHKERGSTEDGMYKEFPNTVIMLVNQKLGIPQENCLSVEDINKARILKGYPPINEDGDIAGKAESINNSYYFLSEERESQIRGLEQQIISGLRIIIDEAISRHSPDLMAYKEMVHNLSIGAALSSSAYSMLSQLKIEEPHINNLKAMTDSIRKAAYQEGFRDDILTPMELLFLGRKADDAYSMRPYTPLGIQRRALSIQDANTIRQEENVFDSDADIFTEMDRPLSYSLEPLNKDGDTERGPLPLHRETKLPWEIELAEYFRPNIKEIPFARPVDWYYRAAQ